jgi:hypothetical protein
MTPALCKYHMPNAAIPAGIKKSIIMAISEKLGRSIFLTA